MSAREDELIASFTSLTGTEPSAARFFLESANWDLDAAASAFFESGGAAHAGPPAPSQPDRPPTDTAAPAPFPPTRMSGSHAPRGTTPAGSSSRPRVMGLGDVAGADRDDDEGGQDYFAGGERSGQVVREPPKPDEQGGGTDLSRAIMDKARNEAPSEADLDDLRRPQAFGGAGFRLGDSSTGQPSGAASQPDVVGTKNAAKTLTFYSNGFTVDDGELRLFDDPANQALLRDIERGIVPRDFEEPGVANVSISLVDKKDQDYVPPKRTVQAFAGSGQRLGGPSSAAPTAVIPTQSNPERPPAVVDENQPVVALQVRLHDGTRLRARFNENHTVGDLRQFVAQMQPGPSPPFQLGTTFPRMVLADDSQSLKDAKLHGAVVVQTKT